MIEFAAPAPPAAAQSEAQIEEGEIQSAYTRLEACEEIEGPALVNERCEGYGGWTVYVGASDHSAGLAFSERARDEQMMQRPVTRGAFQSFASTLEWRVRRTGEAWVPFATIHRWTASTPIYDEAAGDFTGEMEVHEHVLAVAALREDGPIGACHIAYVDVSEVYDANTVARAAADLDADLFRCGFDDPVRIGAGEAVRIMARAGLDY
ncbi:MAG: hypothetical protein ACFE0P_01185 [Oceanicaulis sp.]